MKPDQTIIAERPAARHCPELLRAGPPPIELQPAFARFGAHLAHAFADRFAALPGGAPVEVTCGEPGNVGFAALGDAIGPFAANCLLSAGVHQTPCLVSIEAAAVFAMVDRTFGGRGAVPNPLPESFPLSADMMINRMEAAIVAALSAAFEDAGNHAIVPMRREGSLFRLAPFGEGDALATLVFTVSSRDCTPWTITLAVPATALGLWFADVVRRQGVAARANGSLEAFEDMPLGVEAVLVDMLMPFSAISALQPGQVLPVSVARNVPISVGGRTIAHGQVGAMDDRVAIQITNSF